MAKNATKGTVLSINSVTIPQVQSIGESSGGDSERIDVTTHDTTGSRRQYLTGFKGEETFTFTVLWDGAVAAHSGLRTLFDSGTSVPVVVTYPDDSVFTFNGRVTGMPIPAAPLADALMRTITITVDSAIVETVAP